MMNYSEILDIWYTMRYNIIKEGGEANEEKTKEKNQELHRVNNQSLNRCRLSDIGNCTTYRSS